MLTCYWLPCNLLFDVLIFSRGHQDISSAYKNQTTISLVDFYNKLNLPYNKNSFDKYHKYPAEVVLKRVLKYAWKSKFLIIISLLFLVGFTYLELLQPKLINTVLDDHLLGVQTVWIEKENGDVKYNNKNYIVQILFFGVVV